MAVQDQRALDMTVQFMLSGEADTAKHLLAMARSGQRRLTGGGLGEQKAQLVRLGRGGHQGRLRAFDGDQRLGQPMPDRLKRRDGSTKLAAVQGVLARQRQHCAAGTHQPPPERMPSGGKRRRITLGHTVYR